jgi:predicted nucleic acid-binding protein
MRAAVRERVPLRFVLDASVTLSWAFPDESDPIALRAEQLLQASGGSALVPALWWYEIRNILIVNERRGRITPAESAVFLGQMGLIRITMVAPQDDRILLDLSRQTKLTFYDAAYLALAMEQNIPLATLDRTLQSAAISMHVPILA